MTRTITMTAALALTAGLTLTPALSSAQVLGGTLNGAGQVGGQLGNTTGQLQGAGSVSGSADTTSVQDQTRSATDTLKEDTRIVKDQAKDTVKQARRAATVDGQVTTDAHADSDGNLKGMIDAEAEAAVDPNAAANTARTGVNVVRDDAGRVTGQAAVAAGDTIDTAKSAKLSAEAQAKLDAEAKVDKH